MIRFLYEVLRPRNENDRAIQRYVDLTFPRSTSSFHEWPNSRSMVDAAGPGEITIVIVLVLAFGFGLALL